MRTILAHSSNYSPGRTKKIDRIVLHYTAGEGDTAENNGKYFSGANRNASAHYFVDENSVVQSVPEGDTAWHAGNWEMNCRSIGVEMCSRKNSDGVHYIPERTVNHAQFLVKTLMKKYNIAASGVIRHYDVTGKLCPAPMVDKKAWQSFLAGLKDRVTVEPSAAWAKAAWQWAADNKILDGKRPCDAVTRQELAVVLERLAGR